MPAPSLTREGPERWQRLAELLQAASAHGVASLQPGELDELARLYRRAASDLARAQTRPLDPALVRYLNDLVGRAAGLIYGAQRQRRLAPATFFLRTVPLTFRAHVGYTLAAALIFAVGTVLAVALTGTDPAWGEIFLGRGPGASVEEFLAQDLPAGGWFADPQAALGADQLSGYILINNTKVALAAFALGISFCLGTLWLLLRNGLMLGGFLGMGAHYHRLGDLLAVVAPHGVLELSAIFICGGAGLMLGWALVSPGDRLRIEALGEAARPAVRLVLGCLPLFMLAALIEGVLSPQTSGLLRGNEPRLALGAVTGLGLLAWLLLGDRLVRGHTK